MIALCGPSSWDTPTPVQCIVLCSGLADWLSSTVVYAQGHRLIVLGSNLGSSCSGAFLGHQSSCKTAGKTASSVKRVNRNRNRHQGGGGGGAGGGPPPLYPPWATVKGAHDMFTLHALFPPPFVLSCLCKQLQALVPSIVAPWLLVVRFVFGPKPAPEPAPKPPATGKKKKHVQKFKMRYSLTKEGSEPVHT